MCTALLNRWEKAEKTCPCYRPYNLEANCAVTAQCTSLSCLIGLIIACLINELVFYVEVVFFEH